MNIDRIIAIVSILIGCAVSYWFYRKSLKEKLPTWYINTYNLIQDNASNLSDLQIIFRGKEIKNISVSKIMFWNAGKETIDSKDISDTNGIKIVCGKDDYILDASVLKNNSESINPYIRTFDEEDDEYKNIALIRFNYLDYKKGFVIQIIHTNNTKRDVKISGDIKGVESIKRLNINKNSKLISYLLTFMNILAIIYNLFVNESLRSLFSLNISPEKYVFSKEYWIALIILLILLIVFVKRVIEIRNLSSLPFNLKELNFDKKEENNIMWIE